MISSNLPTLRDAERYVGLPYLEGEFDCGSLAVLVQRELFVREIAAPAASTRSRGRRGQARDLATYQPQLATRVGAPQTGDAVVLWAAVPDGEPPLNRQWHLGTVFEQDGEQWVLHCANPVQGVVLQRLHHLVGQGMHLDGFYTWRAPLTPSKGLTLALAAHPLAEAVEVRQTAAGRTLGQTLEDEGIYGTAWIVSIGGLDVPPAMWHRTRVKPGHLVEVRAVMRKQVLQLVATIALTYFTFGAGGLGAGGLFAAGGAIGGGWLAAAAVYVGGSMLINKFLAPKVSSAGDMSGGQPSPTYSLQGGRNRARPYEPLSLVLGETKAVPDNANQPFAWFEGADQYLSTMFHAGINCGSVSAIKLGDSALSGYEGVELRQYGFPSGNAPLPPIIGQSVDTVEGALLDAPAGEGPWVTRTTSVGTARFEIDLEGTLQNMSEKGAWINASAMVHFQYRVVGAPTWSELGGGLVTLTHTGPKAYRTTMGFDVPAAQYEVRIRKVTANSSGAGGEARLQNALAWLSLKSYQPDTADYGEQPRVEIRMKASGQLNGAPDEINWIARAEGMPYWNGSAWVTVTEPGADGISNPAAQILMLLRGIRRESDGRLIAGAGLADTRIDIESLKAFMVRCAAKGFRHDLFLQEAMDLTTLLEGIAATGMGTMSRHSGRYGVVWMAEDQPIEGMLNMAAMKARSFKVQYDLAATADEYQLEYFDADRSWTWQPIRVVAPGTGTPQRTSTQNVRGVTRQAHAALLARFTMAQNIYGRKSITFDMDLEHLVYRRGSVVALSHDLTQWGYSGRLADITTAVGSFVVRVDEPVPTTVPSTRTLGLRLAGEQQMRIFPVSSVSSDGRELTVAQAWPVGAELPGTSTAVHDALWIYDFKATPGNRVRIISVLPSGNMEGATITAVPESAEFWNYVLTGDYTPPPNNSLLASELPVASNLRVTRTRVPVPGGWEHELQALFDVVGRYDHAQLWVGAAGLPLAQQGGNIYGTQVSWRVPSDRTWSIEIRPFDSLGRMGTRVAEIFTDPSVVVGQVIGLALSVEPTGVLARWQVPQGLEAIGWAATQLRVGATWETASVIFEGRVDSHNLGWLAAGTHLVWAAHRNAAGDWSLPVASSIEIEVPAQPVVTGNAWRDQVELSWTPSMGTQPLRGYEVRVGDVFDDAPVRTVVDALGYIYTEATPGTYMHWVTAIDVAGNRGAAGYLSLTTLPGITDAIAELQEGLDELAEQISELPAFEDRWGIRVVSASGPKIGGIILGTDGETSDFIILADRFAWALPDGSGVKYPLVVGLIGGVASFGFAGNMFIDGTIQARMIDVDQVRATHIRSDEIEARHVKAGAITADHISVGRSVNLVANASFASGMKHWAPTDGIGGCVFTVDGPSSDWFPVGGHNLCIHQPNTTAAGSAYYVGEVIPVVAGARFEFSAYVASHRCNAFVSAYFYNAAGTNLGAVNSNICAAGEASGGRALSGYKRVFGFAVAPVGSATVRHVMFKGATSSGTDSYGFFVQPMLAEALPYQTVPSPWGPSGLRTTITPEGISTPSLSALSATLGHVSAGSIRGGNFAGYSWPSSGNGFYLGPEGMLLGNYPSQFFWVDAAGNISAPGLSISGGVMTISAINVINTLNIAGGAVSGAATASGTGASISTVVYVPPGQTHRVLVLAIQNGGGAATSPGALANITCEGYSSVVVPVPTAYSGGGDGGEATAWGYATSMLAFVFDQPGEAYRTLTFSGLAGYGKTLIAMVTKR